MGDQNVSRVGMSQKFNGSWKEVVFSWRSIRNAYNDGGRAGPGFGSISVTFEATTLAAKAGVNAEAMHI